jgi:DNA-binding PadR family transcriptional regulator
LLGLLSEGPRHAYDLEHLIETRQMRSWTEIGFSSIYAVLKRLERQEFVRSRREPSPHGPARRVYRVTSAGQTALRLAVEQALAVPGPTPPPLLLGLAYLPALSRPRALAALTRYHLALTDRQVEMDRRRQRAHPLPDFIEALFAYSLEMVRAERQAVSRLVRRLKIRPRRPAARRQPKKGLQP